MEFFQLELQIERYFQEQFVRANFDVFVPVDIQLNNEVWNASILEHRFVTKSKYTFRILDTYDVK